MSVLNFKTFSVGSQQWVAVSAVAQQQIPVPTICNQSAQLQMTTATTTQIVALVSGQKVRVCAYEIQGSTTATATTLKLVYGTGTACATGTTQITPAWNMPASSTALPMAAGGGTGELFRPQQGTLCVLPVVLRER